MEQQIWVGLVGVVSKNYSNLFQGGKGAYVNVVTLASSVEDYTTEVERAATKMGLECFEFEEVETLRKRCEEFSVPKEIIDLAQKVKHGRKVQFGEFFVFENFDE